MTADGRHGTQTAVHRLENWVFANAVDRAAGTGYTITAEQIGRVAYQTDTGSYSRLLSIGPLTWGFISGSGIDMTALHFLTTQSESALSNEFNLGGLYTGLLMHGVSASVSTPRVASPGTDYVSPGDAAFYSIISRTITGTSDSLITSDKGRRLRTTNGSAVSITVPPFSSVPFAVGTTIEVCQMGTGQTTMVAGAGVTIHSDGDRVKVAAQYGSIGMIQDSQDVWILSGDLA